MKSLWSLTRAFAKNPRLVRKVKGVTQRIQRLQAENQPGTDWILVAAVRQGIFRNPALGDANLTMSLKVSAH